MNIIDSPELCPDCPLRGTFEGKPMKMEVVGHRDEAVESEGEEAANFKYDDCVSVKRITLIAIVNESDERGKTFESKYENWNSDSVVEAFEQCEDPTEIRTGFLRLQKKLACTALENLQ